MASKPGFGSFLAAKAQSSKEATLVYAASMEEVLGGDWFVKVFGEVGSGGEAIGKRKKILLSLIFIRMYVCILQRTLLPGLIGM